jgi:hypothetical protein
MSVLVSVRNVALTEAAEQDREDLAQLTPAQRPNALEELRQVCFQYGEHPPRLGRVLERASLEEHKV